jgi:hypothetical protein
MNTPPQKPPAPLVFRREAFYLPKSRYRPAPGINATEQDFANISDAQAYSENGVKFPMWAMEYAYGSGNRRFKSAPMHTLIAYYARLVASQKRLHEYITPLLPSKFMLDVDGTFPERQQIDFVESCVYIIVEFCEFLKKSAFVRTEGSASLPNLHPIRDFSYLISRKNKNSMHIICHNENFLLKNYHVMNPLLKLFLAHLANKEALTVANLKKKSLNPATGNRISMFEFTSVHVGKAPAQQQQQAESHAAMDAGRSLGCDSWDALLKPQQPAPQPAPEAMADDEDDDDDDVMDESDDLVQQEEEEEEEEQQQMTGDAVLDHIIRATAKDPMNRQARSSSSAAAASGSADRASVTEVFAVKPMIDLSVTERDPTSLRMIDCIKAEDVANHPEAHLKLVVFNDPDNLAEFGGGYRIEQDVDVMTLQRTLVQHFDEQRFAVSDEEYEAIRLQQEKSKSDRARAPEVAVDVFGATKIEAQDDQQQQRQRRQQKKKQQKTDKSAGSGRRHGKSPASPAGGESSYDFSELDAKLVDAMGDDILLETSDINALLTRAFSDPKHNVCMLCLDEREAAAINWDAFTDKMVADCIYYTYLALKHLVPAPSGIGAGGRSLSCIPFVAEARAMKADELLGVICRAYGTEYETVRMKKERKIRFGDPMHMPKRMLNQLGKGQNGSLDSILRAIDPSRRYNLDETSRGSRDSPLYENPKQPVKYYAAELRQAISELLRDNYRPEVRELFKNGAVEPKIAPSSTIKTNSTGMLVKFDVKDTICEIKHVTANGQRHHKTAGKNKDEGLYMMINLVHNVYYQKCAHASCQTANWKAYEQLNNEAREAHRASGCVGFYFDRYKEHMGRKRDLPQALCARLHTIMEWERLSVKSGKKVKQVRVGDGEQSLLEVVEAESFVQFAGSGGSDVDADKPAPRQQPSVAKVQQHQQPQPGGGGGSIVRLLREKMKKQQEQQQQRLPSAASSKKRKATCEESESEDESDDNGNSSSSSDEDSE